MYHHVWDVFGALYHSSYYYYMSVTYVMGSDALFWAGLEPRGGHAAGPVIRRRPHARHPDVGPPLRYVPTEDPGEPHQVGPPRHRSEGFS